MVLVKPENLSALSTASEKAAALTYLKGNYNWPKSIQFEDKESYNLSFVMNNNSGTIAMNVLKPTGEYTSEHCGTAYLDALVMVDMTEAQRTSLVSKAAEAALQEHITTKKNFIAAQMQAIQVVLYLGRKVAEAGSDPNDFIMESFMNPNNTDYDYRVRCKKCNHHQTQILCDWSKDYDLGGLVRSVLDFTKDHRHGPTPVPSVEPVAAVVEYPKGYRKFREV